jgi:hypothetical protein
MRSTPAPMMAMRAGADGRHDSSSGPWRRRGRRGPQGRGSGAKLVASTTRRKQSRARRERVRQSGRYFFIWEDDA